MMPEKDDDHNNLASTTTIGGIINSSNINININSDTTTAAAAAAATDEPPPPPPTLSFDDNIFTTVLKFSNVLDLHKWKAVSKGFNKLCTKAIKDKCKDRKKKFETNRELSDAVLIYYKIKYQPRRYEDEQQRWKDAEFIASTYGWNMNEWDVSQVKDFSWIFHNKHKFNEDIGSWDTSNATTMRFMFQHARCFNKNISGWDTSKVTVMNCMFYNATSFNQDISSWDTSKVTTMRYMFAGASSFNQPLPWDVSSVTNMHFMFYDASSFNQPTVGRWEVSRNCDDFHGMFALATSFDLRQLPWFRPEMLDT